MKVSIALRSLTRGLQHTLAAAKASGIGPHRDLWFDGQSFAQEARDGVVYGYLISHFLEEWAVTRVSCHRLAMLVSDLTRGPLRHASVAMLEATPKSIVVRHEGLVVDWPLSSVTIGPPLRPDVRRAHQTASRQLFKAVHKLLLHGERGPHTPSTVVFDLQTEGVWVDNGAGARMMHKPEHGGPVNAPVELPRHLVQWLGRSGFGEVEYARTVGGQLVFRRHVEGGGYVFAHLHPHVDAEAVVRIEQAMDGGSTKGWPEGLKLPGDWARRWDGANYGNDVAGVLHFS
jgi:hypothetical protein